MCAYVFVCVLVSARLCVLLGVCATSAFHWFRFHLSSLFKFHGGEETRQEN